MKKLIIFILLMTLSNVCFAEKLSGSNPGQPSQSPTTKIVGIFFEAPATYTNNDFIRNLVESKAISIFPAPLFTILPIHTTDIAMRNYHMGSSGGIATLSRQPFDAAAIQAIAKSLDCDYAFFITADGGIPKMSASFYPTDFEITVTSNLRIENVETGTYIIQKKITKDGSSSNVRAGVPAFDTAYKNAFEKILADFSFNTNRL